MNGEEDRGHISYPLIAGRLGKEGYSAWQKNITQVGIIWYTRPLRIAHELMIDRQGRTEKQDRMLEERVGLYVARCPFISRTLLRGRGNCRNAHLRLVSKTRAALAYVSGPKIFLLCWWWLVVDLITELARKYDWFHHPFIALFFPSGAMIDRKSKGVSQNTPHR